MTDARQVLTLAEAADSAMAVSDEAAGAALRAMQDDVVPALSYFMEHDRVLALRLVAALTGFWEEVGRVDEGREWTERVVGATMLGAARDKRIAAVIPRALLAASELAFRQGDQKQATKRARDTIRAAMLIEDRRTAALAHVALARVAYRAGNAAEIESESRTALELSGEDPQVARGALRMLAWAAHTAGDLDEAERRFEASLANQREHGSSFSVAAELGNLGDLAAERGDLARAARLLAEAIQVSPLTSSAYLLVNGLPSFGVLAVRADADADGARLFGAGKAAATASGMVPDPISTVDDAIATARFRLGEEHYSELAAQGAMLTADEATDLALRVARRVARQRPAA